MNVRLDPQVASAFYGRFPELRPAQEAAIEPILNGENIILTSGTGSGKTEAVLAPIVSKFWRSAVREGNLFLLYIAPTKALVNDLEKRLRGPLSTLNLRTGIRHGDRDDLKSGPTPNILITTPESLEVLLFRQDPAIASVKALIIDEVHLLYNTQRGLQLSMLMRRLRKLTGRELQWAALSATVADLSHVLEFSFGASESARLLPFLAQRPIDSQIRSIATAHEFEELVSRLVEGRSSKLLVFANSRRECEILAGALQENPRLRPFVFTHYSSLSQEVRLETERKFAALDTAICVATSTLELGIDIGDIDLVLLWGVPGNVESFLQRIGRGNRRTSKTNVVCLTTDSSSTPTLDALRFYSLLDAARTGQLPISRPYELFGAVGQQCLSIIAADNGRFTRIADLCELLCFREYMSRDLLETILAELASNGFLQRHGFKNRYGADEELFRVVDLKMIYGNFGIGSQTVTLYHGAKQLGDVPILNLLRVRPGSVARFAGRCWQIRRVTPNGVFLEPASNACNAVEFMYGGNPVPFDPFVCNRLWQLLFSENLDLSTFTRQLQGAVATLQERVKEACSSDSIPFVRSAEGIRYLTFAGYIVNRAIGLFAKKPGFEADDFSLIVPSRIDWETIPPNPPDFEPIFDFLFESSNEQSIYQMQLPLRLQAREYLQNWLKDDCLRDILTRLSKARTNEIGGDLSALLGYPA
jgi:ATP-dependent helicase Lhr and Lhr-like helicase